MEQAMNTSRRSAIMSFSLPADTAERLRQQIPIGSWSQFAARAISSALGSGNGGTGRNSEVGKGESDG